MGGYFTDFMYNKRDSRLECYYFKMESHGHYYTYYSMFLLDNEPIGFVVEEGKTMSIVGLVMRTTLK